MALIVMFLDSFCFTFYTMLTFHIKSNNASCLSRWKDQRNRSSSVSRQQQDYQSYSSLKLFDVLCCLLFAIKGINWKQIYSVVHLCTTKRPKTDTMSPKRTQKITPSCKCRTEISFFTIAQSYLKIHITLCSLEYIDLCLAKFI